jgi:hypothetical protein
LNKKGEGHQAGGKVPLFLWPFKAQKKRNRNPLAEEKEIPRNTHTSFLTPFGSVLESERREAKKKKKIGRFWTGEEKRTRV